jgi:hypothetical protein
VIVESSRMKWSFAETADSTPLIPWLIPACEAHHDRFACPEIPFAIDRWIESVLEPLPMVDLNFAVFNLPASAQG